ncbi:PDR/VanB family oxidoreductase [Paraburkholderia sediminicola]|uniref:PDR/VanB family oxidoreductase n=1 Tax=Paraburkholderia sediminicola TaxID=458836 RepID=UPI0038BD034A
MSEAILVRVERKRLDAEDVCILEVRRADGTLLPPFAAGAHVDLKISGFTRQYSLSNDSRERDRYVFGILREPESRGGSIAIHDGLREGDLLEIGAPRNHFPLAVITGPVLLFAGGIGITPLLCMAEHLSCIGADFQLHYCTRSQKRTGFRDYIVASGFGGKVEFYHDDGQAAPRIDLAKVLARPALGAQAYVCGPQGFISAVTQTAQTNGWSEQQLHSEHFSAPVDNASGDAFDVVISSTGAVIHVPANHSVVEALAERGIEIPVSCEQGVCGTCLTGVLDGEVEHRDHFLTKADQQTNRQFMPCCSRARTARLVLDI